MDDKTENLSSISGDNYSEIEDSIRRLSLVTENQFETIKREKWYTRLWDVVTFSRKGEINLAAQISTLTQAQQIIAQCLLKESQRNKDISNLVNNNASYIEKLTGQAISFKKELVSVSNLMLLINEINIGHYNGIKSITAMCLILSQLDNEVLSNRRALNNILWSLMKQNILNGENVEVIDFLMDVADISDNEVSAVYTELSLIRKDYYASIVLSLIETLFFSKGKSYSKDDAVLNVAITHNIEKKYDSTTLIHIFTSFLNSIIKLKINEGDFSITNPTAKQEREEAERLFYKGKLIQAYPKFIHAADSGDARACYFAARYYLSKYGTTEKSEELYKKYIDLGISRREPLCYFENSIYLYIQGDKKKSDYWRNRVLKQVGALADKGDAVACDLIAGTAFNSYIENYSIPNNGKAVKDWSEEDKRRVGVFISIYKQYSSKAIEAGYWPAAYTKCFSFEGILDGSDRNKNIEKYGWMLENVEWFNIQMMLGSNYLALDRNDYKYYKNAADCYVKAYKLQKDNSLCGYIKFFLNAGVISESEIEDIDKKNLNLLYYKGLDSNDIASLHNIGELYFFGVSDKHLGMDKKAAFEYYEKAYETYNIIRNSLEKDLIDKEKAELAFILGYMTFNGIGTKKDYEKAVLYYQDEVQRGEKRAIKPLANCYMEGIGVNKDMNMYNELMSMIKE